MNRIRPTRRLFSLLASLVLVIGPGLPPTARAQAGDAADCSAQGSSPDPAGCRPAGLSRFRPPEGSAHPAPSRPGLSTYDPAARAPRQPRSPDMALTEAPSLFIGTLRWLAAAMITVGLGMMAARAWIRDRIRKSDDDAALEARRMLREAEQPRLLLAPAPAPVRRIQWTAERIAALDDDDYTRLCASYWETRGYEASRARVGDGPGSSIELRRLPDSKLVEGLVCCLPRDDGRVGVEAVRWLSQARHRQNLAMAVIMHRGELSQEAAALAAQHAVQTLDEPAVLNQLRTLSQDQQEALFAELEAYSPADAHA